MNYWCRGSKVDLTIRIFTRNLHFLAQNFVFSLQNWKISTINSQIWRGIWSFVLKFEIFTAKFECWYENLKFLPRNFEFSSAHLKHLARILNFLLQIWNIWRDFWILIFKFELCGAKVECWSANVNFRCEIWMPIGKSEIFGAKSAFWSENSTYLAPNLNFFSLQILKISLKVWISGATLKNSAFWREI